jgi:hypothetical protein
MIPSIDGAVVSPNLDYPRPTGGISMGATRAYRNASSGTWDLSHFNDVIVAKLILPQGNWLITGRVVIHNGDNDWQPGVVSIVRQANVIEDIVRFDNVPATIRYLAYVQTIINVKEEDTVTLNCNTYKGEAQFPSLIAFDVDSFELM